MREQVGYEDRFHRAGYRQLMRTGRWDPAQISDWNDAQDPVAARQRLAALAAPEQCPELVTHASESDPEHGTTTKLVLRLADGREVESVGIPMTKDTHLTACVSTQVGCRMGCGFCRTARMGLVRNLSAHEIIGQVIAVERACHRSVRNVVFMGMGEPLDNIAAVAQAVRVLTDRSGLALAWNHVTVSTVGRIAALAQVVGHGLNRANLAISLHAADDAVRAALVPTARRERVADLRQALTAIPLPRGRRLMISAVVIPGVTDRPELVAALAEFCNGLPALINLIPFNPFPGCDPTWQMPTTAQMADMSRAINARGIPVRKRTTKGVNVLAACGQLATRRR